MTAKRERDDAPEDKVQAATTQEAKGSVHEAIGKLIGDDAAQRHGAAEKRAGAQAAEDADPTSPA